MLCFKFRSIVVENLRRLMPLLAVAALLLSTAAAQADLGDQLFKLLPDDGAVGVRFGVAVAISDGIVIVGAERDWDNGFESGSAYLFDAATGQQIAKLLPDDGAEGDRFGFPVAISGTTAIVGAMFNDDVGTNSGSAYLFDTTTGQQTAKLLPDDGAALDQFGRSVAISGTIAIVGAFGDGDNGLVSGSAYLFDTTTGQQIFKLLPNDGAAGDLFGVSAAISGGIAIVGAERNDDIGGNSGSAYLFDTATGSQITKLLPNDGAGNDRFGWSVAISGTTAIVGAYGHGDNGFTSGSAYLFDVTTGQQVAELLAKDGDVLDRFGWSVAISGTIAIVGAFDDDDNGASSGSAYLFDTTTGSQIAKLLPDDGAADDDFGYAVTIGGSTGKEVAIVGARQDDDNGFNSGSAYLFGAAGGSDCPEDSDGRVTICHIPPGDPDNAHTIRVSVKAVPAHLAHGDHCGPCDGLLMRSGGDAGHDPCPTDLDHSGDIGAADLAELLGAWGPNPGHPTDLDGDGEVGPLDLALVLGNWGPCP